MTLQSCNLLKFTWNSSCLYDILATCIPSSIIALTIIYDASKLAPTPRWIKRFFDVLSSPFRNFLLLDDLEEAAFSKPSQPSPRWKLWALVALPILGFLDRVSIISYFLYSHRQIQLQSLSVTALAWLYATLRTWRKGISTPPYLILIFYISNLISASIQLFNSGSRGVLSKLDVIDFSISFLLIYIIGTLPLTVVLPGSNVASEIDIPSNEKTMPEDSVNLWQWCTFSFVEPILRLATTRRIEPEDVWTLSPYFKHKNLFNKYLVYRQRHPKHSLVRFLIASNSLDLILDVILELWSALFVFLVVYSLQQILNALADGSAEARRTAYFYAFVTFCTNLSFAQVDLIQTWHTRRSYERTRGQLFCALHYKALRRRDVGGGVPQTRDSTTRSSEGENADLGKIVNLMTGDAYTVAMRFWQASTVFAATVQLIISLIFLHRVLGWSAFAGVAVVLVAYVLNYPLTKYSIYVTKNSWKARDARSSGVNEIFQNIRFLKFYGWESLWADRVIERRKTELRWRVKENIVAVLISFIWIWVPSAMALFSFLFYTVVQGGRLSVSKTFTSLSLFSMLQGPMMSLPEQIFSYIDAYISLQRINAFLREEEVPDWACSLKRKKTTSKLDKLGFKNATFKWFALPKERSSRPAFHLGPLNVNFPLGKLTLVTGATGSGKSALLLSLLGETHCMEGEVMINKSNHEIAYCAQNPWLEHATIRDNIIFGYPGGYDETRYEKVIFACALQRDLAVFEAGDLTEIGEKGVTLSGGQRARVALARALYSEANCILLDDPLAAVDMHTAKHIVEHCLRSDLVKGRTVILVTHHISLCLSTANYIIELSNGRVIQQGLVKELQATGELRTVINFEDIADREVTARPESRQEIENEADFSNQSTKLKKKQKKSDGKLIEAENRAKGRVTLRTYFTYVRAAGWFSWFATIALMLIIRLLTIANDLFLAKWSEAYESGDSKTSRMLGHLVIQDIPYSHLPPPNVDARPWLMVYLWISLAGAFATLSYISLGYYASLKAAKKLFISMLLRLIKAPTRFFDITPIGRILNRFSLDMATVDYALQQSARAAFTGVLAFIASFLFIVWVVPQFTPFALIIAWLYIRIAPPYIQASRDLRRLESVSLSPAFAGFDELLRGLSHVRAFGMEERYQEAFYRKVDTFQTFDHVYWLVAAWLRWRYDCLGSVVVFVTTGFALWTGVSDGFAAIVIVQAGVFAEASRQLVRVAAQLELDFNSVERISEYLQVAQEAPSVIEEKRPPAYWPTSDGKLVVENLVTRYAPDLPPVLNGISFSVNAREKIGVVGRTGSGKSTLAMSLLRIVEPTAGRIILDGIDISTIGLQDLRTRITIVSQDVSLFSGTMRSNLDPFGEHSDHECWDALTRCHLVKANGTSRLGESWKLDDKVDPSASLSAGEKQLVALARAILRHSQVIIMDEATSQIDTELDDKIQRTIREELSHALIITIAHRLKTIIDYDRVLVLGEGGRIAEFDTPRSLLKKEGGVFNEMCRHSADWNELKKSYQE